MLVRLLGQAGRRATKFSAPVRILRRYSRLHKHTAETLLRAVFAFVILGLSLPKLEVAWGEDRSQPQASLPLVGSGTALGHSYGSTGNSPPSVGSGSSTGRGELSRQPGDPELGPAQSPTGPGAEAPRTPDFSSSAWPRDPRPVSPNLEGNLGSARTAARSDPVPGDSSSAMPPSPVPSAPSRPAGGEPSPPGERMAGELEPASFKGVIPGATSLAELHTLWGAPREVASRGEEIVYLYTVAPFDHVEAVTRRERVDAIVIRLNRVFPTEKVAEHLGLSPLRPVLVSNERGEILAQAYPERGVVLALLPGDAPGQANFHTSQIILQPLSAELFLLRAESHLWHDPEASLRDLTTALQLSPTLARAHWLRARVLAAREDYTSAEAACVQAIQLNPLEAAYYLTLCEILQRQGRLQEARQALSRAEALTEGRPHLKAQAACLRAELATRQSPPDYAQAIEAYQEAINRAQALTTSEFPAIRRTAKETLLDAYLGAADCIAFGKWRQKEVALPHWWERAEQVAADLVDNEGRPEEFRLYVVTRAINACTLLKGAVDPVPYADKLVELAGRIIPSSTAPGTPRPARESHWRRQLAHSLYDVAVLLQSTGNSQKALPYCEKAAELLRPVVEDEVTVQPADRFLLGKIFFRVGASYALMQNNHQKAAEWFDKGRSYFDSELERRLSPSERGTLGEMLVSMGVSYWEVGQKDLAHELTKRGTQLVEEAVSSGRYPPSALAAPYTNLATMERQRGNIELAERYVQQARQIRGSVQR